MDASYDPRRVHGLHVRTAEAIDALSRLRSGDPAAMHALQVVRLTRRNLQDHWMPALRDIERSDAMVSWRSSRLGPPVGATARERLPDHLRAGGLSPLGPLSDERRNALLGELDWLDRKSLTPGDVLVDLPGRPTDAQLDRAARELAYWVPRDTHLRRELVELATTNMLVGELLDRAAFPSTFSSAVVDAMAMANGPENGVDPDRYAASLTAALRGLLADPGACLDLLADRPTVLQTLAGYDGLDPAIVTEFVVTGLHVAVQREPARLDDGYRALQTLTLLANGPLDSGVTPAMAVGIAGSMPTYVDGFAIAVNSTRDDSLFIVTDRPRSVDVSFGRYPDVVGLFGVLLREQEARAVFGTTTADWTSERLEAANSSDAFDAALTTSAQFTRLLIDAGAAEQLQMESEAVDSQERKQAVGQLALAGADAAMTAYHVPGAVRGPVRTVADRAIRWIARTEQDVMPGRSIGPEIHRQMVVTAISIGMRNPGVFSDRVAAATPTSGDRRTIEADLAAIEDEDDPERREILVNAMADHVQAYVPALAPGLRVVSNNVAVADLNRNS